MLGWRESPALTGVPLSNVVAAAALPVSAENLADWPTGDGGLLSAFDGGALSDWVELCPDRLPVLSGCRFFCSLRGLRGSPASLFVPGPLSPLRILPIMLL